MTPFDALLLLGLSAAPYTASPVVQLSCGTAPRIDGVLAVEEWRPSRAIPLPGGSRLFVIAGGNELYLGIKLPPRTYRYVDAYVRDDSGRLINMHASMQRGHRLLTAGWTDSRPAYRWQSAGWSSSIAKRTAAAADAPIDQQLEPLEGYELRVPLQMLGRPPYRLRVEVRDFMGESPDWVYPTMSSRRDWQGWARISKLPRC